MFRLPQKVGCAGFGVNGFIGNHEGFRGTGRKVDSHSAEELALGFGNVGVSRSYEHIHRRNFIGSQGHGAEGLNAAEDVDFIGAREMHRGDYGGVGFAFLGRRTGDNPGHTGDFGGEDAHEA